MGWLSGGSLFGINKGIFELEVGSWELGVAVQIRTGFDKELCRNYLYRMRRMNSSVQGEGGRRTGAH